MNPPKDQPARANRLARETSPYLLQHAHNPVDWYPWGPEAFAAARDQDKPIFLSVGYSTCYWCHVMERQSFENEPIAAEMNRRFICVKVDREERPDVDQLYMNAVQAMTGQGGWPMSVFLTPDLRPFHGGTYYPPDDGYGRVGFPRLLAAIDDAWKSRRRDVEQQAGRLVDVLRQMAEPPAPRSPVQLDAQALDDLIDRSASDFDPQFGGFGSAPKFPRQTLLELVLVSQRRQPNPARMKQLLFTLDAMAAGGIRDHLGGAFHRYSTDERWLVPHFEIMLYDNAMLAWVYAEAFAQSGQARFAAVARGILDFVLREMTSPQGAFFTAFDAEVDAEEGQSYLWTAAEIEEVLGPDATLFNRVYGVADGPNFADPHHGSGVAEKNILYLPRPLDDETERKLAPMRQALYARRRQRKQPLLDTKILTSWNALMIRAMAHAGKVLAEPAFSAAAAKAADYLSRFHRDPDGTLYRTSREGAGASTPSPGTPGEGRGGGSLRLGDNPHPNPPPAYQGRGQNGRAKGEAFLDDYSFLAQALLALDQREQAAELFAAMCGRFLDDEKGGFFFTSADSPDMIVRQKTASDSPLPSGNGVAAMVAIDIGKPAIAAGAIGVFAGQLERFGEGMSAMVQAAMEYVTRNGPIAVAGAHKTKPAEPVSLSAEWAAPETLLVHVDLAEGFHINSHKAGNGLVATRLSLAGPAADLVADIDYPPAARRTFPFADEAIDVYDSPVTITVTFSRPVEERPLTVLLHCQPCDETSCRMALTKQLVIE
jgi:uncharacterized protein